MSEYRKKPVVIEAVQWTLKNAAEVEAFFGRTFKVTKNGYSIVIPTLEGDMLCSPHDWIIRGVQGEFYPCKPDIFDQTYEPVTNVWDD